MKDILGNRTHRMYPLAQLQDLISWKCFMEGMISKDITCIQKSYPALSSYHLSIKRWTTGLITKLLEVTHGQWLYKSCAHVLECPEEGRVETLLGTFDFLDSWMKKIGTDKGLRNCLVCYAKVRGEITMKDIVGNITHRLYPLVQSQDLIGWRRTM